MSGVGGVGGGAPAYGAPAATDDDHASASPPADAPAPAAPPPAPAAPAPAGPPAGGDPGASLLEQQLHAGGEPAAPAEPGPAAAPSRDQMVDEIHKDDNWARLPDGMKKTVEDSLKKNGDPASFTAWKALMANQTMVDLANGDAEAQATAGELAKIAALSPVAGSFGLGANLPVVASLLKTRGYEMAPESVKNETRKLLAKNPALALPTETDMVPGMPTLGKLGTSLGALLNKPAFERMGEKEKRDVLHDLAEGDPANAPGAIQMLNRKEAAGEVDAKWKGDALAHLVNGDDLTSTDMLALGGDPKMAGFVNMATNSLFPNVEAKRKLLDSLLQGSDASLVLDTFVKNHGGLENKLFDTLITDPNGRGVFQSWDPRAEDIDACTKILDHLDPQSSSIFVTGIAGAVSRKLETPGLAMAALKGLSLKKIDQDFDVKGVKVGVSWDPQSVLSEYVKQSEKSYGRLLTAVMRHLTEERTNNDETRWTDGEAAEFIRKVKNLPGGGGGDDPLLKDIQQPKS
jgi:hypothetical protein